MTCNPYPPIFTHDGQPAPSLRMTPAEIDASAIFFSLIVRTRRGNITRAYLRDSQQTLDCRPSSQVGIPWQEPVSTGRVWAMRFGHGTAVIA
jgi:hypothetical protein